MHPPFSHLACVVLHCQHVSLSSPPPPPHNFFTFSYSHQHPLPHPFSLVCWYCNFKFSVFCLCISDFSNEVILCDLKKKKKKSYVCVLFKTPLFITCEKLVGVNICYFQLESEKKVVLSVVSSKSLPHAFWSVKICFCEFEWVSLQANTFEVTAALKWISSENCLTCD